MAILQESVKFNNAEQHPSICAIEIAFTCFGLASDRNLDNGQKVLLDRYLDLHV